MLDLGLFFIVFSLLGIAGMTFAPALFAFFFYRLKKFFVRYPTLPQIESKVETIEVLIPVHNHADALEATLSQLSKFKNLLKITVGLNACTDKSPFVAEKYNVNIMNRSAPGKWGMLCEMVAKAEGDWLVLMDNGTILPDDFFDRLHLDKTSSAVFGIAPRYFPNKLSKLQKLIWIFESTLKKWENIIGGPVSVHGACVIYRRDKLQQAMNSLNGFSTNGEEMNWLNDDVVIPLWLRFQNPHGKLIYRYDLTIDDFDVHSAPPSPNRRKRLIQGNLDWIGILWPLIFKSDLCLFILSSRRVARVLWAWWPSLFYLGGLAILAHFSIEIALIVLVISSLCFLIMMTKKSELPTAFISSLLFFKKRTQLEWK